MLPCFLSIPALVQPAPEPPKLQVAFNAALLEAGLRSTPAVRALEDRLNNPGPGDEAELRRLATLYAPFLWAIGRKKVDHPTTRLLALLDLPPWAGVLKVPPTHAINCYLALGPILDSPRADGLKAIVVARAGILMAQEQQDDIAEGLLWGVTAEVMLRGYSFFDSHARQALAELFRVGAEVILVVPTKADPFQGPLKQVKALLQTLPKAKADELRGFMEKLETLYGTEFRERNGHAIWAPARGRKAR